MGDDFTRLLGSAARGSETGPDRPAPPRGAGAWKWAAIIGFAAAPWIVTSLMVTMLPAPPTEPAEKAALFNQRTVDTVLVGDSRVGCLREAPFARRGWKYFNMAMSGFCPEDMAMQLAYALNHGSIRRVVIGASFDNMSEAYPFEVSRYAHDAPFDAPEIVGFATVCSGPRPVAMDARTRLRQAMSDGGLPMEEAHRRLGAYVGEHLRLPNNYSLPNGDTCYQLIEEGIKGRTLDLVATRDPSRYFREHEGRFLRRARLAEATQELYRKVFRTLRAAHVACVVYETGRTRAYQRLLDAEPTLARLQRQWRDFFRRECHGSIKFLDAAAMADCYRDDDFFDALHFMGGSSERASQRLAEELAKIENTSRGRTDVAPAAKP
jgi:hypothetical protein